MDPNFATFWKWGREGSAKEGEARGRGEVRVRGRQVRDAWTPTMRAVRRVLHTGSGGEGAGGGKEGERERAEARTGERREGRGEGGHRGGADRLRNEDATTQGGGLRCGDVRCTPSAV